MTYQINVDRDLCSGLRSCVDIDPETFALGADGIAVAQTDITDRQEAVEAARACPMGAISVFDGSGKQLV